MNGNFAEYHLRMNADLIRRQRHGRDRDRGNRVAAIANAVYHATGKRVRDLPITLDKLITPNGQRIE